MQRRRALALVAVAASFAVAIACSEAQQKPLGNGDDIISDLDSGSQGPPPEGGGDEEGGDENSVFAPVDSGYPAAPDGYAPLAVCGQCGCPAGTFCFGGGTGYTSFNGDCHADGGPMTQANASIGCFPIPAACSDTDAACDCLIQAVSPFMTCYPDCVDNTNVVYCPHP
jgi:hypothetical protein